MNCRKNPGCGRRSPGRRLRRSGLTLLFVISFIVLFLLMGTAFVVVSTQFYRTTRQRANLEADRTPAKTLVYRAVHDIIAGPSLDNIYSPLRTHGLLADHYGYGASGFLYAAAIDSSDPQFLIVRLLNDQVTDLRLDTVVHNLSDTPGYYDGLVFTFVTDPVAAGFTGRVKGISTRIVRYEVVDNSGTLEHRFYLARPWSDVSTADPFAQLATLSAAELQTVRVLINGRPFLGTGTGVFNAGATATVAALSDDSLKPNTAGRSQADLATNYIPGSAFFLDPADANSMATLGFVAGSPNESYDIPDFQNMFLAEQNVTPSYFQPALLEYQADNVAGAGTAGLNEAQWMAQVSFRPFYLDAIDNTTGMAPPDGIADPGSTANSQFPFANIYDQDNDGVIDSPLNLATVPFDVDNDGDGIRDSVWVDFGFPIQYDGLTGRRYKPLVAAMIVDLDHRLNLNAMGNLLDAAGNRQATDLAMNNGAANTSLPRGQFLGPPEVSLTGLFGAVPADYSALLTSRYGNDGLPGAAGVDAFSTYKLFDYPNGAALVNNLGNSFASPLDIHGRFAVAYPQISSTNMYMPGIDVSASSLAGVLGGESANSAYEMAFAGKPFSSANDVPFDAVELERILRQFDKDVASLPNRLATFPDILANRNLVTSDSWEVPSSPGILTEFLYQQFLGNGVTPADARLAVADMLSIDVSRGMKFDLNRAFGDGVDNTSPVNGIIDEIGETNSLLHPDTNVYAMLPTAIDRYQYMKQLYVLGYIVARPDAKDLNGDTNIDDEDKRYLAQWVANIADFRDVDSICTPFEFDLNPYNGWDVDGDLSAASVDNAATDRAFVWGTERPELLITETFAGHDRAAEDTDLDTSGNDMDGGDTHFDSRYRPRGSGFIELYNPWLSGSTVDSLPAAELHEVSGAVDLDRATPTGGDPVWRMLVVRAAGTTLNTEPDPDDPDTAARPAAADVDRTVYFIEPPAAYDQGYGEGQLYFSDQTVNSVGRGQYALLGGYTYFDAGVYHTKIGRRTDAIGTTEADLRLTTTRGVSITPATGAVSLTEWDATATAMATTARPNAVGIVINRTLVGGIGGTAEDRTFSFSEPTTPYYPIVDGSGNAAVAVADGLQYTVPHDVPLDQDATYQTNADDLTAINQNETTQNFRVVHLQRLADPTQDWDADTNPYLTVDSSYVDLVAYNGFITGAEASDEEARGGVGSGTKRLVTMERGAAEETQTDPDRRRVLWNTENESTSTAPTPVDLVGADSHNYSFEWFESLAIINDCYLTPRDTVTVTPNPFLARPNVPFSWLTWNNRPYTSQYELANVPAGRSSRLLHQYTLADPSATIWDGGERFGHLPNFYGEDSGVGTGEDLYRLVDFLEVPSRFTGTEEFFDPVAAANVLPPFDRISRYRNPGKLNINTVQNQIVWDALVGPYATGGTAPIPNFANLVASRQSSTATATIPTEFPSVFRRSNTGNHVPQLEGADPHALVRRFVDTGVFRQALPDAATPGEPLFAYTDTAASNDVNDPSRSAYFQNDMRNRLGNTTTTNSNVFAIWVTVGYFESTRITCWALNWVGILARFVATEASLSTIARFPLDSSRDACTTSNGASWSRR